MAEGRTTPFYSTAEPTPVNCSASPRPLLIAFSTARLLQSRYGEVSVRSFFVAGGIVLCGRDATLPGWQLSAPSAFVPVA